MLGASLVTAKMTMMPKKPIIKYGLIFFRQEKSDFARHKLLPPVILRTVQRKQ
jgi:hypothetical protein